MANGTLKILTTMGEDGAAVAGVSYAIKSKDGQVLYSGITNENGESGVYTLSAPDKSLSLEPNPNIRPYSVYDVWVGKTGFHTYSYIDVEVFEGIMSVQEINMEPYYAGENDTEILYVTPPPTAALPSYSNVEQVAPPDEPETAIARTLTSVAWPDYVRVKLGVPSNSSARIVQVRFIDYVKNVVCSEIYPTWPNNSIIANTHCIVSFVLNRIYTEWYPVRGYNFDITNSTTVDQYFVYGRQIFANISQIVDGIFNVYARRVGFRNPYFTEYCNGTTATCKGLSQWGTVTLANRGFTPLQILHNYYPNDLALFTAPAGGAGPFESYPGVALSLGSTGENVRRMQERLNRIRVNYPAIPQIPNPNGTFDAATQNAVRIFQRTFNLVQDGVVGRSTWNRINQIWSAVVKLSELNGEGERIGLSPTPPTSTVRQGSTNRADNIHIQFLINYAAQFYPDIPRVIQDGVFGPATTAAVQAFQRRFGLTADGVVGPATWRRMYEVVAGIIGQTPPEQPEIPTPPQTFPPFPGTILRQGSRGANVTTLQQMLNNARQTYPAIPELSTDGVFGPMTNTAVRTFQLYHGLNVDGIVGPITWNALRNL